jgi:hypothetical protein
MKKTKQSKLEKVQDVAPSIEQILHPQKRLFIETFYATDGNVSATTKAVKVHRHTFYDWYKNDPIFSALIDEQKKQLMDEIDAICRSNAKKDQGITERIFWLKTHHPEYQQKDVLAYKDAQGNQFVLSRGR